MDLNVVYQKIRDNGIKLFSYDIPDTKAATIKIDNRYNILMNYDNIKNSDEEFLVAVHEYGHCMDGAVHKLGSSLDVICKHEYRADRRAILDFLPVELLQQAIQDGCKFPYEFAEYLDMPEEFVRRAFEHYRNMGKI